MDIINCANIQCIMLLMFTIMQYVRSSYFDDLPLPRVAKPPSFYQTPINVTYEKGHMATLQCSILNLGTKTVIWRKWPYNVPITVGLEQFLEINRFYLSHVPHRDTWDLLIKNVQPFDAGTYECQIASTDRELLRRNITLHVIERNFDRSNSDIRINGTRFVEKGDTIHLSCNTSGTDTGVPPRDIEWFKDGNKLNSRKRSDMSVNKRISYSTNTLVSKVIIYNAYMTDTGTYVCRTSTLQTESFKVDVLNAETNNVKREYEELTERGSHYGHSTGTTLVPARHNLLNMSLVLLVQYIITLGR